jgi:hypothetical protein
LFSLLLIFRKINFSLARVICTPAVTWASIFHGQELTTSVNVVRFRGNNENRASYVVSNLMDQSSF